MPDSVTINGQGINFDHDCAVLEFLRDRMPSDEVLFSRWMPAPKMHASVIENFEAFTPPYAPLPPIGIGELQWPTGVSRYARALYMVDRETMLSVARAAWGYDGELLLTEDDVPSDWGTDAINGVTLTIFGEESFTCSMLPLPPYRVPGTSAELWLLPLVDARFLRQQIPYEPDGYADSWAGLFGDLQATLGLTIAAPAVASEYGVPDPITIKPGISAAALLDCAALSVNLRPVVDPATGIVRLLDAPTSNARCQATFDKSTIVAGGFRGKAVLPSSVAVFCRKAREFSLVCDLQEKVDEVISAQATFTQLTHSAWIVEERLFGGSIIHTNAADTGYYVEQLAEDMATWFNSGGSYAFAGAINYAPSGYDDYLTIKTAEVSPKQYTFTSRVFEVPSVLLPNLLLSQYPDVKVASLVEKFVADDQTTYPLEAYFPLQPSKRVYISGLTSDHSGQTVTAFYRCGTGWTLISAAQGGSSELIVFTLTSDLAKTLGATASANANAPNTIGGATASITVTSPGKWRAFTNASGIAARLSDTLFWILQVDQPARVRVVLDANPTSSGTGASVRFGADPRSANCYFKTSSPNQPVALTAWPFNFLPNLSSGQAANPRDLMGVDGDIGILEWDYDADAYYLAHVYPAQQQMLWATVATNRPAGLGQTVSCNTETPASIGAMPSSPFNVVDTFNVAINAQSSLPADRLLVLRDHVNDRYIALESTHRATVAKALVNGTGFTGTPSTFNVDNVLGYDGTLPSTLTGVKNRYGWSDLPDNSKVDIRWDPHLEEWYATQMVCPS